MDSEQLHGLARLQVYLSRMEGAPVPTRGWTYNALVDGCMAIGPAHVETMHDTLDGILEMGPNAVSYLRSMTPEGYGMTENEASA